jgi:transcriptional regulator with XRE-family HTH domain
MSTSFARYLKSLRETTGIGSRELARIAGLSSSAVCQYERGEVAPRPETLKAIARALDVPFEGLAWMAYTDDESRTPQFERESESIDRKMNRLLEERRRMYERRSH